MAVFWLMHFLYCTFYHYFRLYSFYVHKTVGLAVTQRATLCRRQPRTRRVTVSPGGTVLSRAALQSWGEVRARPATHARVSALYDRVVTQSPADASLRTGPTRSGA